MKKVIAFIALAIFLVSCSEEIKENEKKGAISLNIEFNDIKLTKAADDIICFEMSDLQDAASNKELTAKFNIVKDNITETYNKPILYSNNKFSVEQLELLPGSYQITSFEILKDEKTIYQAIDSDSEFKGFVNNSLPIALEISNNDIFKIKYINIPVICSKIIEAEKFGWSIIDLDLYNLYKLNFLVIPFQDIESSLSHQGNLEIQRVTKNTIEDNWNIVEGFTINVAYNQTGTLPIMSFLDFFKIDNNLEGYKFTFSDNDSENPSYENIVIHKSVDDLLTDFETLKNSTFKYLNISFLNNDILWECK